MIALDAIRIVRFGPDYAPKDFTILCDDNQVASVTDAVYENNQCVVPLAGTRCTSVQLKITGVTGPSPAVRELELLGRTQ